MSPIERAARALYAQRSMQSNVIPLQKPREGVIAGSWERLHPNVQEAYFREVRTVLTALYDPNEAMEKAWHANLEEGSTAETDWQAMIDAVLHDRA